MLDAPLSSPALGHVGQRSAPRREKPGRIPQCKSQLCRKESAELTLDKHCDGTTGLSRHAPVLGLHEHSDDGLGAGRTDEDAPASPSSALTRSTASRTGGVSSFDVTRTFSLHCVKRWRTPAASPSVRPSSAAQSRSAAARPSPVTWSREVDDVARLLAAEDATLALERLEDVAVADIGRDDADPVLPHQRVEAEVRHLRDGDEIDPLGRARGSARIPSPSTTSPRSSTAIRRSPSPSKARPSRAPVSTTVRCRSAVSVAPQPRLMFVPSGALPIACTVGPEPLERLGREARSKRRSRSRPRARARVRSEPNVRVTKST